MIENTELTLNILRHFARDDVPYPSNLHTSDLHAVFQENDQADIDYSVICSIQAELLDGKYSDISTFSGRIITISHMDGLSQKGGEYVRNAASYYEKAANEIQKIGVAVSTEILSEPPRVYRRVIILRGLVDEDKSWIFSRSTGTCGPFSFNDRT